MPVASFVPSRIHYDYPEWTAPGGGDTGKVWAWNGSGYVPVSLAFDPAGTAAAAVAAHVAAANPHSQYYLASGVSAYGATLIDDADAAAARGTLGLGTMAVATEASYLLTDGSRAGATSSRQAFTGGITTGSIRPPVDGATAFQVQNAAGTPVVTVDTTNKQLIITSSSTNAQVAPYIGAFNDAARTRYFISYDANFSIARAISPDGNRYLQTQVANGYAQFVTNADLEFVAGGSGNYMQFRPNISGYSMILTDGRLYLRGGSTNTLKFSIQGVSGQTNNLQEWQDSSGGVLASMSAAGAISAGHSNTATAFADLAASTTSRASLRIRSGTAPTTPNVGDVYQDGTHVYMYLAGAWKQLDN